VVQPVGRRREAGVYRSDARWLMVNPNAMQQPAIQAALDNLVEVIRTALTAEFLEYFRDGDARAVRGKPEPRAKKVRKAPRTRAAKKPAAAKKATRRTES